MKKELDTRLVIVLVVVVVALALAFLWKGAAGKKDSMSPFPKGGLPIQGNHQTK